MKTRLLILAAAFTLGILASSCGASKNNCPAYGQDSTQDTEEVRS